MSVDITQDEMNILNLNGISADDAKARVDILRSQGYDDNFIRQDFDNTLQELKPITKQGVKDTGNIQQWNSKGPITPYEAGERMFQGRVEYNNVSKYAGLSEEEKAKRIAQEEKEKAWHEEQNAKIQARNERVNNGTGSFLDRFGALLDRWGNNSAEAAYNAPVDATAKIAGVQDDGHVKTYRDDIDKSKSIGFKESLMENGFVNGAWIPFVGGFTSKADTDKLLKIKDKILNNEEIRPDELDFLNRNIEKMQEEQVRGYTIGGKISQGFLPSLIRFGSEMAVGGWAVKYAAGLLGLSATDFGAGYGAYKGLRAVNASKKAALLGGKVAQGLTDMAVTGAVNTALPTTYNDTYENFIDRKLNNEFNVTKNGEIYFSQATEAPAKTFLKSLGTTFVMFTSEASGKLLGIPVKGVQGVATKYVTSPISKYLMSNPKFVSFMNKTIPALSKMYEKMNGLPVVGKSRDWLKDKVRFDGFFEEMGEEVLEDFLSLTLGLSDEERNFKNYAKAIFKSPDEWAVLAGAIMLQGGTLSVASHIIGSQMERNGATDEEIAETLKDLSQEDLEELVFNKIQQGEINVDNTIDAQEELQKKEETNALKETLSNKLQNANIDKDKADAVAAFFASRGLNMKEGRKLYNEALAKGVDFTNEDVLNAVKETIPDIDKTEYSPEEVYNNFVELQNLYADGGISEEEMDNAILEFEEYVNSHPEMNTIISKRGRNENNEEAKQFAQEIKTAIDSGNLPTKEQAQKYAKAGHKKLTEIIMKAKELYSNYKRSNTAITKRAKKRENLGTTEGLTNAVDYLTKDDKRKLDEEFKRNISNLSLEVNDYLDDIGALKVADDEVMFQSVSSAGAEGDVSAAQKEWKEKGTESKYFKKWFKGSKIIDANGKPVKVYHGSLWNFDTFGKSDEFDFSFSPKFAYEYAAQKSFEQALDLSPVLYSVYLKAENPFDFRDEKSVNELLKKIGDKEINFWGNKYSHEQFKDLIMGLSYENTVKNQEVFDKAEVGMAYSRYNEDVEEKMSSVADAKIVYKNKDYFVALDEIDEPRRSPFSSEPAGRVDRDDVYKQVEKLAKDIDFADEYIKKITLNTNLVKTTYEVGKGYVDEYTPYELTVRLRKVDNPKIAKKGAGYDNWSFFETTKIGDTYFLDFLKENGYDSYYKQEKEQLNISVFNPEQIKSVDNQGTFDSNNANIYYQSGYVSKSSRIVDGINNVVNKNTTLNKEITLQDIFNDNPVLYGIKDYFNNVQDVKVIKTNELADNEAAMYDYKNNIIYINNEIKNSKISFIFNFLHEMQHAKQYKEYKKYVNLLRNNKKLSKQDKRRYNYLKENIEETLKANQNISKYFDKHQKDLNKAISLFREKRLDLSRFKKYKEVLDKYNELVDIYNFSVGEVDSNYASLQLINRLGLRNEFDKDVEKQISKKTKNIKGIRLQNYAWYETLYNEKLKSNRGRNLFSFGRNARLYESRLNDDKILTLYQAAFHGSAAKFDKFNTDFMGTGEGAQAHGWGLYFASDKEVSEGYRKKLTGIPKVEYNGKTKEYDYDNFTSLLYRLKTNGIEKTKEFYKEKEKEFREQAETSQNSEWWNNEADEFKNVYENVIDSIDVSKIKIEQGQLFEVDIPDNEVLLDEDKNINEQSEKVQKVIKNYFLNNYINNGGNKKEFEKTYEDVLSFLGIKTGKDFYKQLADFELAKFDKNPENYDFDISTIYLNNDKQKYEMASKRLNNLGIKGITYDGKQDGRCYVIFDDSAVNIIQTFYQEAGEDFDRSDYKSIKNHLDNQKVQKELDYNGYFVKNFGEKDIIAILNTDNPSTVMHELFHWYIETLESIKDVDTEAQRQLDLLGKLVGHNDGESWSVQHHERIARSFEAYLLTNKAPSNQYKNLFEKFRAWFREVYPTIEKLIDEANGNIDVSDEAKEVFDRIFFGDKIVEDRKEAKRLASKIKNVVAELPEWAVKENTNFIKEKKDEAIEILAAATGQKKAYYERIFAGTGANVANNSKRMAKAKEKIEQLLEENIYAGDRLERGDNSIAGRGYAYYVDANDIQATGDGGAELVERVYDDLLNNNFYLDVQNNALDTFLDDTDAQYNYLLNEFKKTSYKDKANEKQRSIVVGALFDWLESIPEEYQEVYSEKFFADTSEIERRENMDIFDKAKEDILKKAKEIRQTTNKKSVESFKQEVINILKNLDFLHSEDKAKLLVDILDTPNNTFLEARINDIIDIAKTMDDISYRKELTRKIHEHISDTKNIKRNNRTVGKYDYSTNKIFETLREYDKLTVEQANEMRLKLDTLSTAEDEGYSFAQKIINEFITFKANGSQYADTAQIKRLYDDIIRIEIAGRNAKTEQELFEKLDNAKDVDELLTILDSKTNAKEITKTYINWFGNAESTLNALFNKHIANKYGAAMLQAETDAMVWIYEKKKQFEEEVGKIFNLPKWNWDKRILEKLAEKYTFNEYVREYDITGEVTKTRAIPREMNKMEIILAWMWNMNDVLSKRLENQFGEEGLNEMFSLLDEQDMQLGSLMIKTVNDFYPEVNDMFIKKYGLDMPKVQCYFPSTPERAATEIDLLNEYNQQGMNTGFTKQRSQSEKVSMSFHNPIQTLYSHIDGVGKFIKMTEILDKSNKVLKAPSVLKMINNKYGEDARKTLVQILANVSYKAKAATYSGLNKVFNNLIQNWVQGNVILRPIVGLKQLLSASNYAVDMPYLTWQIGFLKTLAHPKQTIDYMMNIPYLKARFGANYSNEFLQQTIENSKFAKTKKLKDYLSLNIKLGDIGAIIFGGKPYIDYLISQGKSEKEAIDLFILSTQRSQQSSAVSSLSNLQVSANNHPIAKIFTAYKNSPQQYMRMVGDAIVSVANGDMTKKQCAKVLFNYLYIQPLFYTMAGSGSLLTLLLAGDDDDLLEDLRASIFNLNSSAIPLLGDVYQFALNKIVYKNKVLPQTTPMLGDLENEIAKISKDDVTLEDYLEFVGFGVHLGTGVNGKAVTSMAQAFVDIANGDLAEGALKAIGYSKRRAKHITGN